MKTRILFTLALILGMHSFSHAVVIESWQFNDAQDTGLNNVANTGSIGTAWNSTWGDPAEGAASGDGMMTLGDDGAGGASSKFISTDYSLTATLASAITSGTYQFDAKIDSWNLTGATSSTQGQGITFRFGDGVGGNTASMSLDWRGTNNIRNRHFTNGTVTGSNGQLSNLPNTGSDLWLRIAGDLDTGSYTSSYSTDGSSYTAVISDGANLTTITELIWAVEGTDPWVAGEFVDVDFIQLEVIPEPGTFLLTAFGLLAVIGFSRKRH